MVHFHRSDKHGAMTHTPPEERVDTAHLRDYSTLHRSVTDRKVAGVAGGLGRHLNVDPTILRVAFVVLCFFGGAGFLLYAAAWLFVPEEGKAQATIHTSGSTRNGILIATGVLAALLLVGDSWGGMIFPWPLALIALVVFLVLSNRDKATGPPDNRQQPPGQAAHTAAPADEPVPDETLVYPAYLQTPQYAAPVARPRADRGPALFWPTVALLAIALGSLGLYDVAEGGVVDAAYPALALAVVGAMLVVGAWVGRAGGLIALGVVAALGLAGASVAEPRFGAERTLLETPTSAVQVEDRYFVPAGAVHVDLSDVRDVEELDGRTIEVAANAGELVVTLPEGVDVDVDADVAIGGEVRILGEERGGPNISMQREIDGGTDAPSMDLELDLVVGSIEVRQ
jgi:phage shock protein PspC (stress-responsive transcriptional regulator)